MSFSFKPAWWLKNQHLQTLWPVLCRRRIKQLSPQRERFELPDGDFVDVDWVNKSLSDAPIVLVLHGLEGSIDSPYTQGMLSALQKKGWRGALLHFRSCSGEPNRLIRSYHGGDTTDLQHVVTILQQRETAPKLAAIGFSLGANVLLKWLGETPDNPLVAAVAISVPFELEKTARHMDNSKLRLYQRHFISRLRNKMKRRLLIHPHPSHITHAHLQSLRNLYDFDDTITAPINNFTDARHYYSASSCRQYLHAIRTPTLILHAKDDPLIPMEVIPAAHELSPQIQMELTQHGGHVGFVQANRWGYPSYWLEKRVPCFLEKFLD